MLSATESAGSAESATANAAEFEVRAIDLASFLGVDVRPETAGYVRAVVSLLTALPEDSSGLLVSGLILANLDRGSVEADVRRLCPAVSIDLSAFDLSTTAATTAVTDTLTEGIASVGEPGSREGQESTTRGLASSAGALTVGDVVVTVGPISFRRIHEFGSARETDEVYLNVSLSFDRGHGFAPSDLVIIAPDGVTYPADADQVLALDEDTVRFAIDREVSDLVAWQLRISSNGEEATVDIGP